MFVGYAEDHAGDVYRFLNIHTKRIIMSRDVRWLNIIWKHYRMKSIYAGKQVELFLDEEERSIEEERSVEEDSVEEEEETEGDGHNTPTQKVRPGHKYDWGQKRNIGKNQESNQGNVLTMK